MSNIETLTQHTIADAVGGPGILVIDFYSTPTLIAVSDGEVIGAYPGVAGAEQLAGALDQLVATPEPETVLQEGATR